MMFPCIVSICAGILLAFLLAFLLVFFGNLLAFLLACSLAIRWHYSGHVCCFFVSSFVTQLCDASLWRASVAQVDVVVCWRCSETPSIVHRRPPLGFIWHQSYGTKCRAQLSTIGHQAQGSNQRRRIGTATASGIWDRRRPRLTQTDAIAINVRSCIASIAWGTHDIANNATAEAKRAAACTVARGCRGAWCGNVVAPWCRVSRECRLKFRNILVSGCRTHAVSPKVQFSPCCAGARTRRHNCDCGQCSAPWTA